MFKIALKFILYDKPKSFGALFGVIISVFLIGQQSGIFIFLTGGMSRLVSGNPNVLWVVDSKTTNVNALGQIDTRVGYQIQSIKGVKKVYPFVIASGSAKFANGKSAGVSIVGTQSPDFVGGPWNIIQGDKNMLMYDGALSTDMFDSKALGDIKPGEYFEINGKKVYNAVQTSGVRGFGGIYAFTTIERARMLGKVNTNKVSAFLVKYEKGADSIAIQKTINENIFGVKAWTSTEFDKITVKTVLGSSGIAISIGTMIVFATIAGFVIIGLTLYSATIDRIKDYGTLKAIGATNGYIRKIILCQAIIIALVGFVFGYALVEGFRNGIAKAGTIFNFTPELRIALFCLTIVIAISGTLFAIRRIVKLEPAAVFRG